MDVECFKHALVFVVVTVPSNSVDEIGLVAVSEDGEILGSALVDLDHTLPFLQEWLSSPNTQVVFVCTFLSGRNTTVLRRFIEQAGYYNISFNGIAYSSLTGAQLISRYEDSMFDIARYFANHLCISQNIIPTLSSYRVTVYVACVRDKSYDLTLAAGTTLHGVQVARRLHYDSDVCEVLTPWTSKPHFYNIVLIGNYLCTQTLHAICNLLLRHGHTIDVARREYMKISEREFKQLCRVDSCKPNYMLAKEVLSEFIVRKRMQDRQ
jgi:hypothetical protein